MLVGAKLVSTTPALRHALIVSAIYTQSAARVWVSIQRLVPLLLDHHHQLQPLPTTTQYLMQYFSFRTQIEISGVCPKEDEDSKSLESHVKIFESTNDDLFDLFAADDDLSERWVIHRESIATQNSTASLNCTMAFLVSCVDMYKCESSCIAMGASGYRWFHVGCCECVGKYCLNFGVNEIRCRNCPLESEQVIDSTNDGL